MFFQLASSISTLVTTRQQMLLEQLSLKQMSARVALALTACNEEESAANCSYQSPEPIRRALNPVWPQGKC
ncbi:MAG: hypothetical protein ACPIOQ_06205 [Promethearchaeia archaeon]